MTIKTAGITIHLEKSSSKVDPTFRACVVSRVDCYAVQARAFQAMPVRYAQARALSPRQIGEIGLDKILV